MSDGNASGTFEISIESGTETAQEVEWMHAAGNGVVLGLHYVGEPGVWRSDGTPSGTYRLADWPVYPSGVVPVGGLVYFHGPVAVPPMEIVPPDLWRTDGTAAGTLFLTELPGFIRQIVGSGGNAFLSTQDVPRLYRSDGTPQGTFVIEVPLTNPALATGGDSLWYWDGGLRITDGLPFGARWVADTPRPYRAFFVEAGHVYFFEPRPAFAVDLWASDGTDEGTGKVGEIGAFVPGGVWPGAGGVFVIGVRELDLVLWHSRGTTRSTAPIAEFEFEGSDTLAITSLRLADHLYFFRVSYDADGEHWLWRSDGTAAGTHRVARLPLAPAEQYGYPYIVEAAFLGSTLYFAGVNEERRAGLWAVDLEEQPSCLVSCDAGAGTSGLRGAVEMSLGRSGCPPFEGLRVRIDLLVGQVAARLHGCPHGGDARR